MDAKTRAEARAERFNQLTQTAGETLMGRLLRTFWQPVACSQSLPAGTARPLRILTADFTLFRGDDGQPYLVAARCAHRCALLHTGWVEGRELRCMYHGWKYDGGSGRCTEMPAERQLPPESVTIAAYPVHEYGGLIFAYFGAGPAPEFDLPRKHAIERSGNRLVNLEVVWDCNWFQQVENSLDGSHLAFVHKWGEMSRFGEEITTEIPDLAYAETSAGLRQTATRSKNNVRVSDWTFPNNNHVKEPGPRKGDPWIDTFVWAVPIDDRSSRRFFIFSYPDTDDETNRRIDEDRSSDYDFVEHAPELFEHKRMPLGKTALLQAQDYVAVRSQGVIADRAAERLGQSDAGIALLRRVFLRELDALRDGRSTKVWTRLRDQFDLPISIPQPVAN